MSSQYLIKQWFSAWETGNFYDLPISENFKHTSPFGTIKGKKAYLDVIEKNQENILGYVFEIQDAIYEKNKACVRYKGRQGDAFSLDVSEWYYIKDGLMENIVAYYHIGEIRSDRQLK